MSVDTMPLSIRADHVRVASWQAIRARMMPISTQQYSATSATAAPMFASATPYPRHCMSAGTRAPCPARHVFDSRNMSAARQTPTAPYEHEVPIDIFHLVDISSTRTGIVFRVKTSQTALEQTE